MQQISSVSQAPKPQDAVRAKIREVAEQFEAMFVSEMLKPIFSGINVDPVFGGGHGEEAFRSMMIDEYGKAIAGKGNMGVADNVEAQLLKLQEIKK